MPADAAGSRIDRRALVGRHPVVVDRVLPESPLSVGNGELCFTVDLTGLQTFPERYPVADPGGGPAGTLLGTQAQWGWHACPPPGGEPPALARTRRTYDTPRGPVPYVDLAGGLHGMVESQADPAELWLRSNPHRLDLGRIGLVVTDGALGGPDRPPTGPPALPDLRQVRQHLDLWTGTVHSRFILAGQQVAVSTACHPVEDAVGLRIAGGELTRQGRLGIRLAFPYGSEAWSNAADWTRPAAHSSTLFHCGEAHWVQRILDDTAYTVWLRPSPGARLTQSGPHELLLLGDREVLELVVGFTPGRSGAPPPSYPQLAAAAADHWPRFWRTGAAVDLAGSTDQRAEELERRIVLSQYLTAIHCAGTLPPQETGLMANSWRGKFHLEMHWWHGAHFPLWGRGELLERSLGWYQRILPQARETARGQGYTGARWPKMVGPDGRESPSPIGPFLIWQQPHPIVLAELVRRATGDPDTLSRYAEMVLATADFMADFAVHTDAGYQLGPPLMPAQEAYQSQLAGLTNPTYELAYWQWGLRIAQRWRQLLGLPPEPRWTAVAEQLVRPAVRDGRYAAIDVPPYTVRRDHPSMLLALGLVPPGPLVDPAVMRETLHGVLADWDWESSWGWDYPAMALTATWLGEPETAVRALLWPARTNTYLPNGHNRQSASLPLYLPGNGGLLTAVALLAYGDRNRASGPPHRPSAGSASRPASGFPADGRWQVRQEGLLPYPENHPAPSDQE